MKKKQSDLQLALLVYKHCNKPITSHELLTTFPTVHNYVHYYIDRANIYLWRRGLIDRIGKGKGLQYTITDFGKTVAIDTIDKLPCYRKMIKKSDRMRSVQAEQEIKSENKLFNTAIEKEAPQIQPIPFLKRLKFLFTNTL